ncbi:MAG: 3'(2'),5'-bisphosphate nucleotidase CysQ [Gammaproteobacteria bacterium]|nr:3'(2'),5'-bisphosphate nucleotidase CysQ [Gammaproteobacteria bacterium]
MTDELSLLAAVSEIAKRAGEEILEVYRRGGNIPSQAKSDDSPLTEADTRANALIVGELQKLTPSIPMLSEESALPPYAQRQLWREYWLIDPLDGTKEFINRNDEFTVNIALVRGGVPVLGVVHAPALAETWTGLPGSGAWKQEGAGSLRAIGTVSMPAENSDGKIRVVASRRHGAEALQSMLDNLARQFNEVELVSMGSSLKICILAEGGADIYPRLAPTSEWDTAAAQAVLCAAGGMVCRTDFSPLRYNSKDDVLNPFFLAMGDAGYDWPRLLGKLL